MTGTPASAPVLRSAVRTCLRPRRRALRSAFSCALIRSHSALTASVRRLPGIAEHVRMAPHQLFGDRLDHVAELEQAGFLGHAGVKHDLQQQVAKLVAQIVEIAPLDRVRDLVGFLDGVGRDGGEVLLQIPRASGAGRSQRRHDLDQADDIAGGES